MSGDSPELEALFDSIVDNISAVPAPAPQAPPEDNLELENLFDSIAEAISAEESTPAGEAGTQDQVFAKIGQMTRSLHNLLRELGYDQTLLEATRGIPDTRDRLNYIAVMTAQAAERTLNAAEAAQPIQEKLGRSATELSGKWDQLFNKQLGVEDFKALVQDTRSYLHDVPTQTQFTNNQLMQIILAQDFQDLTGQVIKKVLEAAQDLEQQLVALLLTTTPEDMRQVVRPSLLEGPVVRATGRTNIVTSQEEVDDLLDSLGF